MVSVSVNLPKDLLDEVDDAVDESLVFENRSQYVRTAIRTYQEGPDEDFRPSS